MWNQQETDCIIIEDFSYPVVNCLIEQIYTNFKADIHSDLIELLKAAVKYQVDFLAKRLEKVMIMIKF